MRLEFVEDVLLSVHMFCLVRLDNMLLVQLFDCQDLLSVFLFNQVHVSVRALPQLLDKIIIVNANLLGLLFRLIYHFI